MSNNNTISLVEASERISEAEEEHDQCPECGSDYIGADMTGGGDLVFIHDEDGATSDGCRRELEGVDNVDW